MERAEPEILNHVEYHGERGLVRKASSMAPMVTAMHCASSMSVPGSTVVDALAASQFWQLASIIGACHRRATRCGVYR
jgi:hypothetical protein